MKAILFDFDGTLADTIPVLTEAVNDALALLGYPGHNTVKDFVGHGARELMRRAMPAEESADEKKLDHAFDLYLECYLKIYLNTKEPYPGLRETIRKLRPLARIGVLSNRPHQTLDGLLGQLFPPGSFDAVVGFEEGKPGKPDVYLSNKVSGLLGVPLCDCLLVGDSEVDVAAAKNAGMAFVGAGWGFSGADALRSFGAEHVANTQEELWEELKAFLDQT